MALFMLRLSGLLSLERSHHNDLQFQNFTNASMAFNTSLWPSYYGGNSAHGQDDYGLESDTFSDPALVNDLNVFTSPFALPLVSSLTTENQTADVESRTALLSDKVYRQNKSIEKQGSINADGFHNSMHESYNKSKDSLLELKFAVHGHNDNVNTSEVHSKVSGFNSKSTDNSSLSVNFSASSLSFVDVKMEEFLEDEDGIFDAIQEPSPEFQYYDFTAEKDPSHVPPSLTSHSLVSPVPYPRQRAHRNSSGVQLARSTEIAASAAISEMNETKDRSEVKDEPQLTAKKKKLLRPSTATTGSSHRNNPYPYGPIFLPGYSNGRSGVDSNANEDPSSSDLFRSKLTTSIPFSYYNNSSPSTASPTFSTSLTSLTPVEEYDYDYEVYEYKDNSGRKVLTEKPAVLFHFEGPGYSPEPPSTTPPPVRSPTPSDPWNCSPRCPNYTLEDWNPFYDVRRYPAITWLSTIIIDKERVLAELEGYMRLQDYFYGLNDRGQVLNLSVPFVTQIKQGRHPGILSELNDFTISLHVPEGTSGPDYELPTPISNEVLIDTLEPKTVFVSSFQVDVWDVTAGFLRLRAEALMDRLRSNGEAFIDRYYYLASYSRPELYQPVYYEIWVYATSLRSPRLPPPSPLSRPKMPPLSKITQDTMQRLCRGVECPSFEVVRTFKYGIQKRRYYDVVFVSVSPGDCYFSTLAVWKGFMPLHLYKHGINSHMEVVEATRPIAVVRVREDSTPNTECPQNLTMSLFLPRRLHAAPPVTGYTAPGPVIITSLEDVMVYAYTVGGYLLDPGRVRRELSDLKYRLSEFGACYREDVYYIVVYDFISRYHGRQNEIWIVAENCRATTNG